MVGIMLNCITPKVQRFRKVKKLSDKYKVRQIKNPISDIYTSKYSFTENEVVQQDSVLTLKKEILQIVS